jgi:hypothetical protein
LKTATKHFDDPSKFAQSEYFLGGNVADVHFAHERYKMVLAQREHLNIAYDHHLIMIFVEHRLIQDI